MGFILKTLFLLAALFLKLLAHEFDANGDISFRDVPGNTIANWMLGIWAFLVVYGFYGRRVEKKAKLKEAGEKVVKAEKKEKDTVDAYAIAEQEIEANNKDEGIWKKAFVDGGGDESKQKALYMKYRAEEIINS